MAAPTEKEATSLYRRLLQGDALAPSDLTVLFLDYLAAWLQRRNPRIDPQMCDTAAEDALLSLIKNPASYKPNLQSLDAYLRMSASGDLKNLLRRESRHGSRRAPLEAVELATKVGNYEQREDDPANIVEQREDEVQRAAQRTRIPDVIQDSLTPVESKVLDLMRDGVRHTAEYATVLGITDRPITEQRKEVKRTKDRLMKRMQRAGGSNDQTH